MGLPADRAQAAEWYRKAAEQGLDSAQCPQDGLQDMPHLAGMRWA